MRPAASRPRASSVTASSARADPRDPSTECGADDQPASEPGGSGWAMTVATAVGRCAAMSSAIASNCGKVLPRHRLGEDVDDPAAGQADGERVVVADAVALQLGLPGCDDLVGEFVDGGLDAAAGHRAGDRAVGGDDHGGAGRPRRGAHRAHDGRDARCAAGSPDRQQARRERHARSQSMPATCENPADASVGDGVEFDGQHGRAGDSDHRLPRARVPRGGCCASGGTSPRALRRVRGAPGSRRGSSARPRRRSASAPRPRA